ncbi:MAG: hypothetical protein IPK82_24565 [Polyangiaceae bacterium]|nr:hypothetical protein [Polyangiaceae bacterium]
MRGLTIGPIENARHSGKGYGTEAYTRALDEAVQMGATWVSLTPFGRVENLTGRGVDLTFEAPFEENRAAVLKGIELAHQRGLKVLLVPHLWVMSGEWRALIDPGSDEGWATWAESYAQFLLHWADVAEEGGAEMLSVGVELRSWVTTSRAELFLPIIHGVRSRYRGLLTYSANWDDVDQTAILQQLDVIGINAFYPLAENEGASLAELCEGGQRVTSKLERLAKTEKKPILLTEIGYKTVTNPAVKPWIWPEDMKQIVLSENDQAEATYALLHGMFEKPWFAGFFVWRVYADPADVSQEPEYGFSPRGKLAERVIRDAFTALWAADGNEDFYTPLGRHKSTSHGLFWGGVHFHRAPGGL